MAVYIVSYELRKPGKDYKKLYAFLQTFAHCHHQTSTWFIDSALDASQIRDQAQDHIDDNDIFFVGELKQHWAARNVPCSSWLKDAARTW